MCCIMRNLRELKVRCYADCIIYLNEYLVSLPGAKVSDKIGEIEINEILLNSMTNEWIKQAYVQIFDFKTINFKRAVNMLEHMETSETIYEGFV